MSTSRRRGSHRPAAAATRWGVGAALLATLLLPGPATAELAFTAYVDGVWTVHRLTEPGSAPQPVRGVPGSDAAAPALSPDGRRVAFELPGQGITVCALEEAGSCSRLEAGPGWAARPAWEPRSGELVFARYRADARGEDSEILRTRGGLESVGPLVSQTGNQDDPDLSPDGSLLVYSSAQTVALHQAGVRVVRHLWVMDLATGSARPLAPGADQDLQPDWSPDGERIAFSSDRSGQLEIWVIDPRGAGPKQLTSGPGLKTWPAWSPDGSEILYTRSHEGRQRLWIVPAGGGDGRPFEPFGEGSEVPAKDGDWR